MAGRHTRRAGMARLRRLCLAALIMLVVQYGLGMVLNLYVAIPASDAHADLMKEIASGPFTLTLHALLGLALIATAIVLLVRAVGVGNRPIAGLAAAGLTAIGGAFASGEIFVRTSQNVASLAMALLTGVALLCYLVALARASSAHRHAGRTAQYSEAEPQEDASHRGPAWRPPQWPAPPGVTSPGPAGAARDSGLISPRSSVPASWFTPE
jgi:thiol:disulfide interchange protein